MTIRFRELLKAIIVFAVIMTAVLVGLDGRWSAADAQGTVPPPRTRPPDSTPAPGPAPISSPRAETTAARGQPFQVQPGTEGFPCLDAIAFHSTRDNNLELYLMNGDGSGLSRLTSIPSADEHPAPSPDGRFIAFDSTLVQANSQILVMNVDGTNFRRLTNSPAVDRTPNWSPSGLRIAFESNRDGTFQIWTMNTDGTDLRQLTKGPAENTQPTWSRDDTRIAFVSKRDGHDEIYVMSSTDGANQTRLTNTPINALSSHPAWSVDNHRIAFESNRTGIYEIYAMNADGSSIKQLTDSSRLPQTTPRKENRYPYWLTSCDDRIAFSSNRDDPDFRIWVTDAAGANQQRLRYERPGLLVNPNAPDEHAAWSGAPILPLQRNPSPTPLVAIAPRTPTATPLSQALGAPPATPDLAISPDDSVQSPPPQVSSGIAGFWEWLQSLWGRLTGK